MINNGKSSHFIEPDTHSFIIKLWLDDKDEESNKVTWRGHITHVATGKRQYFNNLREMVTFIFPYLNDMKIRVPIFWRVYQWLMQ